MLALVAAPATMSLPPRIIREQVRIVVDARDLVLALAEQDEPSFDPDAAGCRGEILVRVSGFSLNYRDRALAARAPSEVVIGSEFVGEVVARGAGVEAVRVGERVIGDMSWPRAAGPGAPPGIPTNGASAGLLRLHAGKVVTIPADMPDAVAAAFALGSQTAFAMVRRLAPRAGEKVLLLSASSNTALFCLAALRETGAYIYAATTTRGAAAKLREMGARGVVELESRSDDFSGLRSLAGSLGGFDAVIDPFSDAHLPRALGVLRIGGRYITCGIRSDTAPDGQVVGLPPVTLSDVLHAIVLKNVTVIGNCLGAPDDLRDALLCWKAGRFAPPVDSVHTVATFGAFVEKSFGDLGRLGKVVFLYE